MIECEEWKLSHNLRKNRRGRSQTLIGCTANRFIESAWENVGVSTHKLERHQRFSHMIVQWKFRGNVKSFRKMRKWKIHSCIIRTDFMILHSVFVISEKNIILNYENNFTSIPKWRVIIWNEPC